MKHIFTSKKSYSSTISLHIDGDAVIKVSKTTFLGVIFHNELKMNEQITYNGDDIPRGIHITVKAR